MICVIVPNSLRDEINAKLDAAFIVCPAAIPDRPILYDQLLAYFYEHGKLPEFHLERTI